MLGRRRRRLEEIVVDCPACGAPFALEVDTGAEEQSHFVSCPECQRAHGPLFEVAALAPLGSGGSSVWARGALAAAAVGLALLGLLPLLRESSSAPARQPSRSEPAGYVVHPLSTRQVTEHHGVVRTRSYMRDAAGRLTRCETVVYHQDGLTGQHRLVRSVAGE